MGDDTPEVVHSKQEELDEKVRMACEERDKALDKIKDLEEQVEQLSNRLSDEVFPLDAEDLHRRLEACVDAVTDQLEDYQKKFPGRGVPTALLRLRERLAHLRDGGAI